MKPTIQTGELVRRVKQGDEWAAEMLYSRYAPAFFRLSYQITQDRMAAEDVLQEAFAHSFSHLSQLKDARKYGGWLKRMVVNGSIDWLKGRSQRVAWEADQPEVRYIPEERIPGLSQKQIQEAIASLPDGSRAVFTLHLIEGHTHQEVSELLHISPSTSKSQYAYALKLLRQKLEPLKEQLEE